MSSPFTLAKQFIFTHARLLERLLFAVKFEHADLAAVGHLISAYQNPNGGLGHALEPDMRCPESQPLFIEVGLSALHEAGWRNPELALLLCSFLESVCDPNGLVGTNLPNSLASPHAPHWTAAGEPGLNPTAGICGLLLYQGIQHPWLSRATQHCCRILLDQPPKEAHALLSATHLAEYLPDQRLAELIFVRIAASLPEASFFIPFAPAQGYGLTPLHFAPTPDSLWRHLFSDEQIEGHLKDLFSKQQPDGGWPITWEAPGPAAVCEWRGKGALEAVSTLIAYGFIKQSEG